MHHPRRWATLLLVLFAIGPTGLQAADIPEGTPPEPDEAVAPAEPTVDPTTLPAEIILHNSYCHTSIFCKEIFCKPNGMIEDHCSGFCLRSNKIKNCIGTFTNPFIRRLNLLCVLSFAVRYLPTWL